MSKRSKKRSPAPPMRDSSGNRPQQAPSADDTQNNAANQLIPRILSHVNRGEVREGMRLIQQGMKSAPKHAEFPHLAGQILLNQPNGDRKQAIGFLEKAAALAPRQPQYLVTFGAALMQRGEIDRALELFRKALKFDKNFAEAHTMVGVALAKQKLYTAAAGAFLNAARLEPENPESWQNLAVCRMEARESKGVIEAVERLERLVPDPPAGLLHQIGNIYRGVGRLLVAEGYYRRALEQTPDSGAIWYALADVLAQLSDYQEARSALDKAEELGFELALIQATRIQIAADDNDVGYAKELMARAIEEAGDNVFYLNRLANTCTQIGDFDSQERCLNRVLEIDPDNPGAFAGLALAPGRKLDEAKADKLCEAADDSATPADTRRYIGFALGDYYRHEKDYAKSMRYYRLGNRLKGYSFDYYGYLAWVEWVEQNLSRDFFEQRRDFGLTDRLPVLIVGMPRSGTTLTEQIVSSHSEVFGAGEYGTVAMLARVEGRPVPDTRRNREKLLAMTREQSADHAESYLERVRELVADGETFVTNKLPHNFEHVGLFALLFPQAPIIHIKRDPRDNLLSIFFQDFAGFHEYAYDLKTLGRYYRLYERLMRHWIAVVPNRIYELQYEELVSDLEGKTRELAAFVGIDLEERMLRFWEQDRKVITASRWQVRQPLYTSSVGRWKPYERFLKPLFDGLAHRSV